ncbi:MAG: RNA 2',3'-cyclic phosphodiesterase [Dehalococcoidia bacterium]
MPADAIRLFVAVALPPNTRDALANVVHSLREDLPGPFRWVAPESLHLTLKFLGDVERGRVELLTSALAAACRDRDAFHLALSGAGTFPGRGSPKVIWVGIGGDTGALAALQRSVEAALVEAGEARQDNPFRPHLTLARVRETLSPQAAAALHERLQAVRFNAQEAFDVRSVGLMHSTLTPEGPIYRTLAEAPLAG